MIITRTKMNAAQQTCVATIDSKLDPVQASLDEMDAELQALMEPVLEVRERIRVARGKLLPLTLVKSAVVCSRSRAKYFPEFYGLKADEVDPRTEGGQRNIAQIALEKKDDANIQKFIDSITPILSKY